MQNDLKLLQEQADGSFLEKPLTPAALSLLAFDADSQPGTVAKSTFLTAEADPIFAAWLAARLPAVPTGLGAAVISSSRIDLTWDGTDGITYKVYQNGVLIDSPSANNSSVTGLTAATLYSFTVSAVNSWGESAQCAPVAATTSAPITDFALQFDDYDSHVDVASGATFAPANLTVECWFKHPLGLNYENCFLLGSTTDIYAVLYDGWKLMLPTSSASIDFYNGTADILSAPVSATDGLWHHVAFTCDGVTINGFIDGQLVATMSASAPITPCAAPFWIGWMNNLSAGMDQNPFNGTLDEIRISSVIRYTDTFVPSTNLGTDGDTVAYWPCNDGAGTGLADASGNGNNGTLVGTALPSWVDGCSI